MNIKNLAMWAVIVFLTIGLYNMFKNPQANVAKSNSIIFSEFLTEVDNGGVVKVDIQGNNIRGLLANGNSFSTYSPCLLYTSPSPRDRTRSRMPSSA